MADEATWRRRFLIFMLVRLLGLITFLTGIAIAYSNIAREGGWPALGAIFAIMGAIDAVFAPKLLKKHWDQEDRR